MTEKYKASTLKEGSPAILSKQAEAMRVEQRQITGSRMQEPAGDLFRIFGHETLDQRERQRQRDLMPDNLHSFNLLTQRQGWLRDYLAFKEELNGLRYLVRKD